MSQIVLDIPDECLFALKIPVDKASDELRLFAAIKLFELGRLSFGAAAQFAGIPKTLFLTKLADYGVEPFTLTEDELSQETWVKSQLKPSHPLGALLPRLDNVDEVIHDFWQPKSLNYYLQAQYAVQNTTDADTDFWPEDESIDDFVAFTWQQRKGEKK